VDVAIRAGFGAAAASGAKRAADHGRPLVPVFDGEEGHAESFGKAPVAGAALQTPLGFLHGLLSGEPQLDFLKILPILHRRYSRHGLAVL
jgi:hypothetical protein